MIGIFTYDIPHRKTYDVLCLLKAGGIRDIIVFAKPLHYQKAFQPLIEHRPPVNHPFTTQHLCKSLDFEYCPDFDTARLPEGSIILICGAGIISPEIIKRYQIINSHPGYLPDVRGLDALKWAIYEGLPIGVTTHLLGDDVDAGLMIEQKLVPLYENDSFHAVAQRQFDMEVSMLVDAIDKVGAASEHLEPGNSPLRKRMPHEKEACLMERFQVLLQAMCHCGRFREAEDRPAIPYAGGKNAGVFA